MRFYFASIFILQIFTTGMASAADLGIAPVHTPVLSPVFDWSGFYAGGHVGWGKADTNYTDPFGDVGFGAGPFSLAVRPSGALGGAQAGWNWQFGSFVLGVEGDLSRTDIKGGGVFNGAPAGLPAIPAVFRYDTNMHWIGSATGRVGYAYQNVLLFVKGGGAWTEQTHTQTIAVPSFALSSTGALDKTVSGWTIGAGMEWGFANNWSAKAEYQYYDFGKDRLNLSILNGLVRSDIDQTVQVVKLGVNYHFNAR